MGAVYSAAERQCAQLANAVMTPTVTLAVYSVADYLNQEHVLNVDRRYND